jgi:hypothetical protein
MSSAIVDYFRRWRPVVRGGDRADVHHLSPRERAHPAAMASAALARTD